MPDDKDAREEQAANEERRQREREIDEARDRADETEPVHDEPGERLGDLDEALADHDYPTTAEELIDAHGDLTVETREGWKSVEDVLAPVDDETSESADDVRRRIKGLVRR